MTQKESVQASHSESGSEADTESQTGGDSGNKEGKDSGSKGEDSGSEGEGRQHSNSQQGYSSGKIVEVSCHEAEESGCESGSSSSEYEVQVKKAHPSKKTVETDPNTTLPELDSKDSEEEQKMSHHGFAHRLDADFGTWQERKISQGLKQWDERDKMTCDHVKPGKEVKCPNLLGVLLDYMERHRVFKSTKMSKYDLPLLPSGAQWGLSWVPHTPQACHQ